MVIKIVKKLNEPQIKTTQANDINKIFISHDAVTRNDKISTQKYSKCSPGENVSECLCYTNVYVVLVDVMTKTNLFKYNNATENVTFLALITIYLT